LLKVQGKDAASRPLGGNMLWTIIAILFALWLLGLIAHVGGGLIHLLLVVALVVFVVNLLTGRRTVV
jgi:K+-transporting ATPase A subunit